MAEQPACVSHRMASTRVDTTNRASQITKYSQETWAGITKAHFYLVINYAGILWQSCPMLKMDCDRETHKQRLRMHVGWIVTPKGFFRRNDLHKLYCVFWDGHLKCHWTNSCQLKAPHSERKLQELLKRGSHPERKFINGLWRVQIETLCKPKH